MSKNFSEKIFRLQENQSNVRTEILAGCITFLTMSYIIFVQPALTLALGFTAYPVLKLLSGKGREVHWLMYVLGVLLGIYFLALR